MNNEIHNYIQKQKSPQKDICRRLRRLIFKTIPGVKEEMKWGVPVFAGGKFYIGALKKQVNLGFSVKGLAKKEAALFEGGGKLMRHIKIGTLKDIDEKRIVKLLKMVNKKSKCEKNCF
ncbi:MAG: hypothetical protein COY66_00980 [Candidatus Kerfeldbacteria bacterium CG_4_10_14_0_8_um_filter_42_10]|uniref:YdhG-like domain-containing protein n=1 Tax=Candidatus Kerfeldbacteria bacterium CG_4_10_14_0_8_um_filter_42_10 TaxID=2014248 RepID=A0A2M7RLA9_9BACT|nr:MAG: hypothetical protein COY66_00980 [Candidatus Kerfeldbacteria bacterium CG_4_10_14_0_8_um_filter_42_10]